VPRSLIPIDQQDTSTVDRGDHETRVPGQKVAVRWHQAMTGGSQLAKHPIDIYPTTWRPASPF